MEMVCIVCPNGCLLNVEPGQDNGDAYRVTGNLCPRGAAFAQTEMTNPQRTICSTVRTAFADVPVLPVRVSKEIPKDRCFDVMREIAKVRVDTVVRRGDPVIKNVCGLGVDVIATSDLLAWREEGD